MQNANLSNFPQCILSQMHRDKSILVFFCTLLDFGPTGTFWDVFLIINFYHNFMLFVVFSDSFRIKVSTFSKLIKNIYTSNNKINNIYFNIFFLTICLIFWDERVCIIYIYPQISFSTSLNDKYF